MSRTVKDIIIELRATEEHKTLPHVQLIDVLITHLLSKTTILEQEIKQMALDFTATQAAISDVSAKVDTLTASVNAYIAGHTGSSAADQSTLDTLPAALAAIGAKVQALNDLVAPPAASSPVAPPAQ